MSTFRRHSSEYSSTSLTFQGQKLEASGDVKTQARNMLYKELIADPLAKAVLIPSLLCGMAPIFTFLVFGDILTALTKYDKGLVSDPMKTVHSHVGYMAIVTVGVTICKFIDSILWVRIGNRLTTKFKKMLFNQFMKSDITFYDRTSIGALLTILCEDTSVIQEVYGPEKGAQIQNLGQFIAGILLVYIFNWKIALVGTALAPVLMFIMRMMHPAIMRHASLRFIAMAQSMTLAEETIAGIRTVRGFNMEESDTNRYIEAQDRASSEDGKMAMLIVGMFGCVILIINTVTLCCFYWGKLMEMETGDLFTTFGFLMFGTMGLITFQNSFDAETRAVNAGARIHKMLQYIPETPFEGGDKPKIIGKIEFRNVSFQYPTRPRYALRNVSFTVDANQSAALVGHSGSGKSTCVQLIERFYDVTEGVILIDGVDIKTIDPRYLHHQISLVSQEPTLFQGSVRDNVLYGYEGTDEEVWEALDKAFAKSFVEKMENGLDQLVGDRGSVVSGGQRQRIAIARALIRNPVIMITDEATSALDAKSEKKVQAALDKAMINRTAVIVAHRLSTIRNANIIYVFDTGEIVEVGDHNSLLAKKGAYYSLVKKQLQKDEIEKITQEDSAKVQQVDPAQPEKEVAQPADEAKDESEYSESSFSSESSSSK